jgi:hypothetical protein
LAVLLFYNSVNKCVEFGEVVNLSLNSLESGGIGVEVSGFSEKFSTKTFV